MTYSKNKNVIVASESPELYTTKRLMLEARKLKYSSTWFNPYEYLFSHNQNSTEAEKNKLYFHRTTGIKYDNFDLLVSGFHQQNGFKITNPLQALEIFRDKDSQSLFLNIHKLS
ncbi:MAG: hypothetical protein EHM20_01950 [Alphaproteobacteria bacterium]|nr:MAG: hypothetical protein EHM20_01950 [Alphaproteobacteria bacterium]